MVREVNHIRRCNITRVIDGDTMELYIDNDWFDFIIRRCRLLGVNAPEINRKETAVEGIAAKEWVQTWVDTHTYAARTAGLKYAFIMQSYKSDAFGRFLTDIWALDGSDAYLNSELLAAGMAVEDIRK